MFLEWVGKTIDTYLVNSQEVPKSSEGTYEHLRKDGFLDIPKDMLVDGGNTIQISFTNDYYNDGNGIHTYTDIDGKQYIYSQGEPHWANKMCPIFDQPDLKGTFQLTAKAPSDWIVISNEPGKVTPCENEETLAEFGVSLPLSCYLFTVIAGPYKEIVAAPEKCYNNITMSIFCRETLYKYVVKQQVDIFEFTSDTIRRYEELFGWNYPFHKSDTIFCPEFTVGAMENPGAITYTEHYVFKKDNPSIAEITDRASTINHELAHMWFGDMVTMKWWDDLWLNESFADFVCYIILSDQYGKMSFPISNGWVMMNMRKGWGYRDDQ